MQSKPMKRIAIMESGSRPLKLAALMIAALFCYHVAIVLAEQQQRPADTAGELAESPALKNPTATLVSLSGARQRLAREPASAVEVEVDGQPQQLLEESRNFALVQPQNADVRYKYRADIDQDASYRPSPEVDLYGLAKLEDLLGSMSIRLAPSQPAVGQQQQQQEQIHRTGRTNLFGADRQQQQQQDYFNNRYSSPPRRQQQQPLAGREQQTLQGLWPQGGRAVTAGPMSPARANGRARTRSSPHHTSETAEVVIHTPLHSARSVSDYEWKRVENSRWNNLRGMWGKRSVPVNGQQDGDSEDGELSSAAADGGANNGPRQQQHRKRSTVSGLALM